MGRTHLTLGVTKLVKWSLACLMVACMINGSWDSMQFPHLTFNAFSIFCCLIDIQYITNICCISSIYAFHKSTTSCEFPTFHGFSTLYVFSMFDRFSTIHGFLIFDGFLVFDEFSTLDAFSTRATFTSQMLRFRFTKHYDSDLPSIMIPIYQAL